jgi:hypothetical protein
MQNFPRIFSIFTTLAAVALLPAAISAAVAGDDLATVVDRTSQRASSFDKTGGNADCVSSFEPGKTLVLLDTDGPGKITHLWFTASNFPDHSFFLRDMVLRIYWENSKTPSVEVPLGDFFGLGHGKEYQVQSQPINVGNSTRALNCYWPMPFFEHARMELTNVGKRSIRRVFFNIDYELGPIPPRQGLFHAEFRRVKNLPPQPLVGNTTGKDNYVILDAAGEGQYVGCFLFVDSAPGGWWGEGDDMMFIDGEEKPSIIGTGTEDYFCNAWGFATTFCYPYYGVPLKEKQPDGWTQTAAYRLHVADPVRFKKSLRVTIEHGWGGKAAYDFSSVAYWYQLELNDRRQPLPQGEDFTPRTHLAKEPATPVSLKISATQAEPALRQRGIAARAITTAHGKSLAGGVLQIDSPGKAVEIPMVVRAPGKYRVRVRLSDLEGNAPVALGLKGGPMKTLEKNGKNRLELELGEVEVGADCTILVAAESPAAFALDAFLVDVVK